MADTEPPASLPPTVHKGAQALLEINLPELTFARNGGAKSYLDRFDRIVIQAA